MVKSSCCRSLPVRSRRSPCMDAARWKNSVSKDALAIFMVITCVENLETWSCQGIKNLSQKSQGKRKISRRPMMTVYRTYWTDRKCAGDVRVFCAVWRVATLNVEKHLRQHWYTIIMERGLLEASDVSVAYRVWPFYVSDVLLPAHMGWLQRQLLEQKTLLLNSLAYWY